MSTIAITKIEETEFIFKTHGLKVINPDKLQIENSLEFSWNLASEEFLIDLTVNYFHLISNKKTGIAKFSITCTFKITELNQAIVVNDNEFEMQYELLITLVSTVIGTARGMMTYKFAGTLLADYHLPLIDASQFLGSAGIKPGKNKLKK